MSYTTIGTNIRRLRQNTPMTQENLAERLGVTPQSISKWENDITAPDISMLPILADVFHVSIDELLGYNGKARQEEIEAYSLKAYEFRSIGDHESAIQILKEGLARFPGDEVLLCCMLYSTNENSERIAIAKTLSETATDAAVKYDALRFLAEAYSQEKKFDMARDAIEKIPEIYFTKLGIAACCLEGEEKRENAMKQKYICIKELIFMMAELIKYYKSAGLAENAQRELEFAEKIIESMKPFITYSEELQEILP